MPLIALVNLQHCGDTCYDCGGHVLIESISDWDEVSEAELEALRRYSPHRIIVREPLKSSLVKVQKAVELAEKAKKTEEARLEAARKKREEKKLQKQLLTKQKSEEEARKLYESLKEKFES